MRRLGDKPPCWELISRKSEMNENSISNWKTIVDKPVNGNSLGRIDQYELIRELGGGGFGTVFLARDTPPFSREIIFMRLSFAA